MFPTLWIRRTICLIGVLASQRDILRHHDLGIHDVWRIARLQDVQQVVFAGVDHCLLGELVWVPGVEGCWAVEDCHGVVYGESIGVRVDQRAVCQLSHCSRSVTLPTEPRWSSMREVKAWLIVHYNVLTLRPPEVPSSLVSLELYPKSGLTARNSVKERSPTKNLRSARH